MRPARADESHLGVRAFSVFASPAGRSFAFVDRIPRERGLGSSAAVVALGLVAGATAAGAARRRGAARGRPRARGPRGQPRAGARRRRLPDVGRSDRARGRRSSRACPSPSIPETRVNTAASRSALPESVARDAVFSVVRAALLGASLASGDARLFAAAADDRLHEPYRAEHAPHLGGSAATCRTARSGRRSRAPGPTVLVWAARGTEHAHVSRSPVATLDSAFRHRGARGRSGSATVPRRSPAASRAQRRAAAPSALAGSSSRCRPGAAAERDEGTRRANASRTTRSTRSRVPSTTGTRAPDRSSSRASSTRPCARARHEAEVGEEVARKDRLVHAGSARTSSRSSP